jgi:hypothetical protein
MELLTAVWIGTVVLSVVTPCPVEGFGRTCCLPEAASYFGSVVLSVRMNGVAAGISLM